MGSGDPMLFSDSACTVLITSQNDRLTYQSIKNKQTFEYRIPNSRSRGTTFFRFVSLSPSGKNLAASHFRYPMTAQDMANIMNEPLYITVWSQNGEVKWSQPVGKNMEHLVTPFFSANEQILYVKRDHIGSSDTKADIISYEVATGKLLGTQLEAGELGNQESYTLSKTELVSLLSGKTVGSKPTSVLQSMYAGRGDVAVDYDQDNALLMSVSEYTDFTKPVFPLADQRMPLTQEGNRHGDPCLIDPINERIIHRLAGHSMAITSAKFVTKSL